MERDSDVFVLNSTLDWIQYKWIFFNFYRIFFHLKLLPIGHISLQFVDTILMQTKLL